MPSPASPGSRGSRREPVLFAAFVALHLVPLWIVRPVPFQDAPVHVENAEILRRWLCEDAPELHAHYVLLERPASGALGHWVLAALCAVVPRDVALALF